MFTRHIINLAGEPQDEFASLKYAKVSLVAAGQAITESNVNKRSKGGVELSATLSMVEAGCIASHERWLRLFCITAEEHSFCVRKTGDVQKFAVTTVTSVSLAKGDVKASNVLPSSSASRNTSNATATTAPKVHTCSTSL